jgi:hypothetical protein
MLNRRTFVTVAMLTAFVRPSFAQSQLDSLIQGNYAGNIRLAVPGNPTQYLGYNFGLTTTPTAWNLRIGHYHGRYCGNDVDFRAYWVFRPDARMCWQAENGGGGRLVNWNQDGHASSDPQDYELFFFKRNNNGTVKIYNYTYVRRLTACGVPLPQIREICWVGLSNGVFNCASTPTDSTDFQPEFI